MKGRTVIGTVLALVALGVLLVAGRLGGPANTAAPAPAPPTERANPVATRDPETGLTWVAMESLPVEARRTVDLIQAGGPYPYAKDGAVFANRERLLPTRGRGFYREYTVPTPGEDDRGPRRIVTGDRDRQFFYTADHYASFVRIAR